MKLYEMMVAQDNGQSLHGHDIHPTDLSPRSSLGSGSSVHSDTHTNSPSPNSKEKNMIGSHQLLNALNGRHVPTFSSNDLSPLQQLQYAFERNSLLSNLFHKENPNRLTPSPKTQIQNNNIRGQDYTRHNDTPPIMESEDEQRKPETIQTPPGSPNSDPANIFQCPLCSIVCNGRHSFNEHLVTHTQHHACPKCDYLTNSEDKLRDHLQRAHDLSDPVEALEEDETSVPKVNSQGKVKTFKCKQCDHVSVTKSESWTHSAVHIRPEKMLKCPKCQFVTEYKHHLEYHLRIHVGSKPYQCNSCHYTCVNKSMLNSHLKSHSAVYQYNCLDCDYQTKYCHSLKMHLRKMNHRPSIVLNPDGTPNPLPIIDVYGTRRGPKMKKPSASTPVKQTQANGLNSPSNSSHSNISSNGSFSPNSPQEAIKIKQESMEICHTPPLPPPFLQRGDGDSSDSDNERKCTSSIPMSPVTPSTLHGLLPGKGDPKAVFDIASKNSIDLYTVAALKQFLLTNPLLLSNSAGTEHLTHIAKEQEKFLAQFVPHHYQFGKLQDTNRFQQNELPVVPRPSASPIPEQTPLDLRHPKQENEKRRRKGKAHRYERPPTEDVALDFSNNNNNSYSTKNVQKFRISENEDINQRFLNSSSPMMCKYCEISFPDVVLYRMHMRYHSGDNEPFLCKSCGKKTSDKISFFLHLTTDSH